MALETDPQDAPSWLQLPGIIVSANDAKYQRVNGADTYPESRGSDTLTVLDASRFPPVVKATVEVSHSIAGPPQAVAITPDGRLAFVSAPSLYDPGRRSVDFGHFLQVVDLALDPPAVTGRIALDGHPQGLSVSPDGRLLLAATLAGTVAVLSIDGPTVALVQSIKVSDGRLAGISFTHDGGAALVALRDRQGLLVLDIRDGKVSTEGERVTTGLGPYAIDISADGCWAVVGNAGIAALSDPGKWCADADTITLVDLSARPFRAVQHITVPSIPESVALSPDGRWIAVLAMDGSNLPAGQAGHRPTGRVLLFEIRDGRAHPAGDLPGGVAGQGIVFTADSRHIIAQFNVEQQLALFAVAGDTLIDTGLRIPTPGGPASLRTKPR